MKNRQLENELQSLANNFSNTFFNFISVEVMEKCTDNMLFEHIRSEKISEDDKLDFINDNYSDELKEYFEEYTEENIEDNLEDFISYEGIEDEINENFQENQSENYPMWNTIFEFRNEPSENVIQAAINAGFGVIESNKYFNTSLFVSGYGYSFMAHHWIPFYLGLPWSDSEKYKDVSYDHL